MAELERLKMKQIACDEGGVVVQMFANFVFAVGNKAQHGPLAGNWDMGGSKFVEKWLLA